MSPVAERLRRPAPSPKSSPEFLTTIPVVNSETSKREKGDGERERKGQGARGIEGHRDSDTGKDSQDSDRDRNIDRDRDINKKKA